MDGTIISKNLRRLRVARGFSQEKVAALAEIARPSYVRIEAGDAQPKVSTLMALAEALGVSLSELVTPIPSLLNVRFRALKKLTSREQILAQVGRWLNDYRELEDLLGAHQRYNFSNVELPAPSEQDPAVRQNRAVQLARHRRKCLELGNQPIRDICGLLESAGVKLFPIQVMSDAFFGLSVAPDPLGPAVIVNTWERISVERQIFSAAHELGHLLLHLSAYVGTATDEVPEEETEANLFASEFLMPQEGFDKEWKDTYGLPFVDRVLKVKRIYRVSYKTVLYRLWKEPDYPFKDDIWQKFAVQYRRVYGKLGFKDEPYPLTPDHFSQSNPEPLRSREPKRLSNVDFVEDRLSGLVRKAIDEEKITLGRGAEILGLSLDAMRERTECWV